MNRLVYYVYFCFLLFYSQNMPAQTEIAIKGQTLNEDGKSVGSVTVTIDNKKVTSTGSGAFQVYLKQGTAPQTVTATKAGLAIKEWNYDAKNRTLTIVMHARRNTLRGEIRNKFNEVSTNVYVFVKGVNDDKPAKTDNEGKFSITLPDDYKPNKDTPFFVDGLVVDSKEISFKDDHFVVLRKPQAAKEIVQGEVKQAQEKVIEPAVVKEKEKKNPSKIPDDFDYKREFEQVYTDLENQRRVLKESGEKVRGDLSRITDKVREQGISANRAIIRDEMLSLEMQLAENNKAYNESQLKTNEVIERLKNELIERDSLNSLTQEKLKEVTQEKKEAEERFNRNILIASVLIVLLLVLAIVFYFAGKRIQKQSRQISLQSQEIKVKNTALESQKDVLEQQKIIIEKKNLHITASINYAQRIQCAMLPSLQDIQKFLPKSFLLFKPKEAVSGDFYWVAEQKDDYGAEKVIIAAVDCTGHGVPGAFMSMVGDGLLNQIVKLQQIISPELILKELDKGIRDSLNQDETDNKDGMDIAVCVIDKYNDKLEFAGAKNPLIYIQNGELHEIAGDKLHIGGQIRKEKEKFQNKHFTKHIIDTTQATTCYIFSDGFEDQFGGESNKKFTKRQLYKLLLDNHQLPIEEQKFLLERTISDWMGINSQIDDILVMGFQI